VLATLRPDGSAALVPIVFARSDGALWSTVDAKPKRSAALARLSDVARAPRVALLLDHYGDDWSRLWWLRVEGRAEVCRAVREVDASAEFRAAAAALRMKYAQYAETPLFLGVPTLQRIAVERIASWAASPAAVALAEGE
jgi:PPOX class probable F420-dependent enzyme